ncbi:MAG: hypothetical protein LBE34_03940 [Flavobacteriaceae bacterium]|jgi:hypothetical protein|nr:hypothetical protein [Flavobacteriaceae bacterium]
MKYFYLLCFCLSLSFAAFAQEKIQFNPHYSANTIYEINSYTNESKVIDFKGDVSYMIAMKRKGIKLPIKIKNIDKDTYYLFTQPIKKNKTPFVFSYEKFDKENYLNDSLEQKTKASDVGLSALGYFEENKQMKVTKVVGTSLSNKVQKAVAKVIEDLANQAKYPNKEMGIGESFDVENSLPINIEGIGSVLLTVQVTYLLTDIKEGKAYFTEKIQIAIDGKQDIREKFSFEGGGQGLMIYDVATHRIEKIETTIQGDIRMDGPGLTVTIGLEETTRVLTTIIKPEDMDE